MVELRRQSEIIDAIEALWSLLLAGAPQTQQTLSFNLYHAALAVAVHGREEVSSQLAAEAASWRAARLKRSSDETKRFRTARVDISPTTAAKRRYRKPRK